MVLTGSESAREVICRSVYRKSRARARWCLERLLRDPAADVRITALGALTYRPDLHGHFSSIVRGLANDADPRVRGRTLEFLFQHDGMEETEWRERTLRDLRNWRFRHQHPQLLSFYLTRGLERGDEAVADWALGLSEAGAIAEPSALDPLVRYPKVLSPFRNRLVDALDAAEGRGRAFLVAALTAIDGEMRGTRAEDWTIRVAHVEADANQPQTLEAFTVEAEWAHRLHPNFEVADRQDQLCLMLGEGAGAEAFWREHAYSSVDIGKAFFTFRLERGGMYQIWCRCWFSDKCGNHSLLHIDDRWLQWRQSEVDDRIDTFRRWHWKRLETNVRLSRGQHTLKLTAADDGLLYDKLAVLPVGTQFDTDNPPPLSPLYDPAIPPIVSITPAVQSQQRGTTQDVVVWARRNSPRTDQARVRLSVPPPFRLTGPDTATVHFAPASAVASAVFAVHLPLACSGPEVELKATFLVNDAEAAAGTAILGINHDWLTTGPLGPGDPRCQRLRRKTDLTAEDLAEGWTRYPAEGYDRYRRLTFEDAYGQLHNKTIFLYTEIQVTREGDYESFLNIDDCGYVFIDGQRITGRSDNGVGEGWLLVDRCHLTAGRHRVFAWVYQADFPEPEGPDAGRHTPNHWNFKWLLRKARHQPADTVHSVPVQS